MRRIGCIIFVPKNSNPFLKLKNKEIILWVLETASKFFKKIVLVCDESKKEKLGKIFGKNVRIFSLKKFSFKKAIREGEKFLKKEYYLLISSNMPFILEKTLRELLVRFEKNNDCICYFWSLKKFEPYCAIYRKNFLKSGRIESLIKSSRRKILVPISKETYEFFKVNSEKDLKNAIRILKSKWGKKFSKIKF